MTRRSSLPRLGLALAAATALVLPVSAVAHSSVAAPPAPSTPAPFTAAEGTTMSYVVNVNRPTTARMSQARRDIARSGGVVVVSWPQIGVIVAHSTKAAFLSTLRAAKNPAIASAGPTRTAPVTEASPAKRAGAKAAAGGAAAAGDAAARTPDPREGEQWDMALIKADRAHRITDGSARVTVAVVDSGVEAAHPDLRGRVVPSLSVNCTLGGRPDTSAKGWLPTTNGHGTHVAGTIAAARNGVGIVGVAPAARLASVKVVNDDGFIYPEYAVCGAMWTAAKRIPIANHSYYVDPFQFWCGDDPVQAPAKEAVRRAFSYAQRQGVTTVAAAGNSSYNLATKTTDTESPNDTTPITRRVNATCHDIPAELPGVVTVSSVDSTGALSDFSNYGAGVIDVAAPGSRILSTFPQGRWALMSGTSMAAPHAAGVLALLKSTHPSAGPAQLTSMLTRQADPRPCPTGDARCRGSATNNGFYGRGLVDALDAVRR